MTWAKIDDADDRLALKDCQRTKIGIVRNDQPGFQLGPAEEFHIRGPMQLGTRNIQHVESVVDQPLDDRRIEIFVGQELKVPQFHSTACVDNSTSFFMAAAA